MSRSPTISYRNLDQLEMYHYPECCTKQCHAQPTRAELRRYGTYTSLLPFCSVCADELEQNGELNAC
jgi:hypothetical protein